MDPILDTVLTAQATPRPAKMKLAVKGIRRKDFRACIAKMESVLLWEAKVPAQLDVLTAPDTTALVNLSANLKTYLAKKVPVG